MLIAAGNRIDAPAADPLVGVLAVQGAFDAHRRVLARLGVRSVEVRQPAHLDGVDALVIPGGESTTMAMMLDRTGLRDAIAELLGAAMPVFGTCAGAIMLASSVADGRADQWTFGRLDIDVRRNAYGRQVESFEVELSLDRAAIADGPTPSSTDEVAFRAPFIRAPVIERVGPGVTVLAETDARPALVADATAWAATFHPELSGDDRIHRMWLSSWAGPEPSAEGSHPHLPAGSTPTQQPHDGG